MDDDTATVVDGASSATSRRARAQSPSIELSQPEAVLRSAEIEQTRRTAIAGMVFNGVGLAVVPFLGGDRTARMFCIAGVGLAALNNLWLLYIASNERRYHERHVLVYFGIAPLLNAAIIYYLGVFGAILVMFLLNLYVSCLSYGRRVGVLTLVGSIGPLVVIGGLIASGALADAGLITIRDGGGAVVRWLFIVSFSLLLCLTYAHARRIRELLVASLRERDAAVRRASHREALFLEARQDLERALQAGGLGRFTDQTLGSYKLGALLGRGGMGEVYEGTHLESGELAAVKMLLPEVIGRPDYVRRFLREVRIAASLDSPHVVRVLEVGDESAPLPYLAMERLVGEELAQILRREERLTPRAVVELVRQVGRGVHAAGTAGIVHRDLKPQNLFRTLGEPGIWKIIDFGVSRRIESGSTLTRGEMIGTPQYMAPEQARGGDIDTRADLYAIGAIAYRALTGHPPYKGGELGEIVLAVATAMPVRPSALAPLHPHVDLALAIALAKRPDDRFQTTDELTAALESAISGGLERRYRNQAAALLTTLPWSDRVPSLWPPA
jgi:eukaryotic-like serine/threonine-protein kinase